MNASYFHINEKSLSKEVCIDIINLFESETDKYEGQTIKGLNKNIKDTTEFLIPHLSQTKTEILSKIRRLLEKELDINIKQYIQTVNNFVSNIEEMSDHKYKTFDDCLVFDTMQIQKYVKSKGRYVYHNDFMIDKKDDKYRVITFIWYLNNVEEGGETEFWTNHMIKPTAGKLVLFPASWTFPHRGKMPISDDKYIITGWVYSKI